jgi:hypothetical protein
MSAGRPTVEEQRRGAADREGVPWRLWGPYLAERQWGTVRENESADIGEAWTSFTHDQARSRAYRWGEDGLLGICDDAQRLCFALALWNGNDPILKERAFGLTNGEGNHGEDVKEYYHFLDSTPTHSYLKALYRYPQRAYPYADLVATNAARTRQDPEYELIDTGAFAEDRHFDVVVEYAKADPTDLCIRITAHNRGPEPATLHLLPTLWFRNTWWRDEGAPRPSLAAQGATVTADHPDLGTYVLRAEGKPRILVTGNETNAQRLWGEPNPTPYVKDGIDAAVVHGRADAVNPAGEGTKAAVHHVAEVPAGGSWTIRLRLTAQLTKVPARPFGRAFDTLVTKRAAEADEFYATITPPTASADAAAVLRQALASLLWSKQYYDYDLDRWLSDRDIHPLRNRDALDEPNGRWFHMVNEDVIAMPDTWEYPWYAAWDLAFHTISLGMVDLTFARQQLGLLLTDRYLHPNGQIPAYEWNFSDVNPPVHALAALFCFAEHGDPDTPGDHDFLEDVFLKLLLNFTWWVNRKDPTGAGAFEGGFLGLDNIGVFDRSAPLPTGGSLEQADGTAWMALYSQNMLEIAIELARTDETYWALALKFVEHFFFIAAALERVGDANQSMWDDEDGFFYDFLRLPDGSGQRLRVRSMVGLLPFCSVTVLPGELLDRGGAEIIGRFLEHHPDLTAGISLPYEAGVRGRHILTVLDEQRMRRVLDRLLDEDEFLSPHGIRSLSRYHLDHPYDFDVAGQRYSVRYLPAESDTSMFGGNSNWRGPVWFPVNLLIVRALLQYYRYYGDGFTVECPTGSGQKMTLFEVAREIADRLVSIFLRDGDGRRPVFGGVETFQTGEHWRDDLPFYEYFHGDNGAGVGASHQTGWTALVAKLIQLFNHLDPAEVLASDEGHPITWHYRRP